MRPHTVEFAEAVRSSHQMRTEVDVLYNREVIDDLRGLAVVSGSHLSDRTAAVLGRIEGLVLAEPVLIGGQVGVLGPFGYELAVRRGVVYTHRAPELIDLGVFPIQADRVNGISQVTTVTAFDRAQLVIDARLEDDYSPPSNANYGDAIRALIDDGVPGLTYLFPTTSYTIPPLVVPQGANRWEHAMSWAAAIGWELYFDGQGRCCARTEPALSPTSSVLTINDGPGGVLVDLDIERDRGPAYNRWVMSGENQQLGAVYRGVASDTNPLSPTYYEGGFGRKPGFHTSPLYTSDAQCELAARTRLARGSGVARSLDLSMVPNPALEPGDAVTVVRTELGVDEIHLIEQVRTGLAATDVQTARTRTVQ